MSLGNTRCVRTGRAARTGFTLIEVLVVVAIIALLVSILLPSLSRAKEQARRAVCAGRLHNMGVAVLSYAHSNQGKIIQCRDADVQVALDPRLTSRSNPTSNDPADYVDWQAAAKRYQLDRELWECPNRTGIFGYEGSPTVDIQGYTAASLAAAGYRVAADQNYQQWILGYQYFGGIKTWTNNLGSFKSRSPVNANAKPGWALAADSNLKVDGYWGGGRPSAYGWIPPHPTASGRPEGGNVLTFDGAVSWIRFSKMQMIHTWDLDRQCYWYQQDLGDYGKVN